MDSFSVRVISDRRKKGHMKLKNPKYNLKNYISILFMSNKFILLFKISEEYPICPGDWELFTFSFETLKEMGINGKIIKTKDISKITMQFLARMKNNLKLSNDLVKQVTPIINPFIWDDHEFKITYKIYPVLVVVSQKFFPDISKIKKFTESKWIELDKVWQYDRNNYLYTFLAHIEKYTGL